MNRKLQQQKAELFRSLHHQDHILILPNIWDPLGARIIQAKGFPAAATASAAISASLGYRDGEKIKLSTHLEIIKRITSSVDIPVTADIEKGYASTPSRLSKTIQLLLKTGAVGINIEDTTGDETELKSIEEQCNIIRIIRKTSDEAGIRLFINARSDYFLLKPSASSAQIIKHLSERAHAFYEAGADCFYPVGVKEKNILIELRKEISYPINVLGSNNSESVKILEDIGINRVSFGPFVQRALIRKFLDIIEDLKLYGNIPADELVSRKNMDEFLKEGNE